MIGLNHTLAGSIVAVLVPAPFSPFVAFVSHFVLDAFPHTDSVALTDGGPWSKKFIRWLFVDGMLCVGALALALILFPHLWPWIVLSTAAANLPDFLHIIEFGFGKNTWYSRFAHWVQWAEWRKGWILDALYALVFVAILLFLA